MRKLVVLAGVVLALAVWGGMAAADVGGQLHNCPESGEWAISVWSGDDSVDTGDALGTCGPNSVDAAYAFDSGEWTRWFAGRADISNLGTLDDMQGILAFGSVTGPVVPMPTPEPTPSPTPTPTPIPAPTCIPDYDGDGVPDYHDNCKFAFNPYQDDLDEDGKGDICDLDDDGDTIRDNVDNCPLVANPLQENAVHPDTLIGDACEDFDSDGVVDEEDNCPNDYNPDQDETACE